MKETNQQTQERMERRSNEIIRELIKSYMQNQSINIRMRLENFGVGFDQVNGQDDDGQYQQGENIKS